MSERIATVSTAAAIRSHGPRLELKRYAGVLVALVACSVYLSLTQDAFLTWGNWMNIFRSNTVMLLLAVGVTFVLITAAIDLSFGSTTAASVIILGLTFQAGWSLPLSLMMTTLAGISFGLINGLLIGKAKISFFVVTLGTLSIYQSFALLASGGDTITLFTNPSFTSIPSVVNGQVGPVPTLLIVWITVGLIASFILNRTAFGRAVYAVGANPDAANLAGIRVPAIVISVFAIVGLTAALAAVVQAGRLTGASPHADPTLLLNVIAAVLIGGTPYTGGEGGVLGTMIGVLFLGIISNGLALSNVSSAWQGAISGVILIAAVGIGVLRERDWSFRLSSSTHQSK